MRITLVDDTPRGVELYTDGSCWPNPGPGGWAVVESLDGVTYTSVGTGSAHLTTNIKMEGEALVYAMDYAFHHGGGVVYTDSEFWVKVATEWGDGWESRGWKTSAGKPVKNLVLTKKVWGGYRLANRLGVTVKLQWVRGHVGNPGNEAADELAGLAREAEVERTARLKEA